MLVLPDQSPRGCHSHTSETMPPPEWRTVRHKEGGFHTARSGWVAEKSISGGNRRNSQSSGAKPSGQQARGPPTPHRLEFSNRQGRDRTRQLGLVLTNEKHCLVGVDRLSSIRQHRCQRKQCQSKCQDPGQNESAKAGTKGHLATPIERWSPARNPGRRGSVGAAIL